jgi:hypothetical protein
LGLFPFIIALLWKATVFWKCGLISFSGREDIKTFVLFGSYSKFKYLGPDYEISRA